MSFFSRFLLIYLNNDDPFFIGAFQSNFEYYFVFADTRHYIRTDKYNFLLARLERYHEESNLSFKRLLDFKK